MVFKVGTSRMRHMAKDSILEIGPLKKGTYKLTKTKPNQVVVTKVR